jgi:hypothetical protein
MRVHALRLILCCLWFLVATSALAGQYVPSPKVVRQDLQPLSWRIGAFEAAYKVRIAQAFGARLASAGQDGVCIMKSPAFEAESLVTVRTNVGECEVFVTRPSVQLSELKHDAPAPEVRELRCRIDPKLAVRVAEAVRQMLTRVSYQESNVSHVDGVIYEYFGWKDKYGRMVGEANNPMPGTRVRLLADVSDALAHFVECDAKLRGEAEVALQAAVAKLESALVAQPQGGK